MKKYIFSLALILIAAALLFASQPQAYAACAGADTSIISCNDTGDAGEGISYILKLVFTIMTYGAGALGVIGVIIVGIMYMTARDSSERVAKAKKRLTEVVIGLVLFAGFGTIVNFLVPGGVLVSNSSLSSGQTSSINGGTNGVGGTTSSINGSSGSGQNGTQGNGSSSTSSNSSNSSNTTAVGNRQNGSESTAGMTGSTGSGSEGWVEQSAR